MLRSLHIRNYILIDSLDVDFPEGLVIVTGQTGAGKSIILGALSLLSGAKADAGQISDGAESCVVEGEFGFSPSDTAVSSILDEYDIDPCEESLIIRRVVARSGRSRCFVNDIPVPVQCVAAVCSRLLDIHSQHKSLLLTEASFQLQLLDRYAGNAETLSRAAEAWRELCAARRELADLRRRLEEASSESEYNAAQLSRLEEASLREGELEELEQEHRILSNAGQLRDSLATASEMFCPASGDCGRSVGSTLREIRRFVEKACELIPSLSGLAERLDSARIELDDIASEIDSALGRLEPDEGRLAAVEERLQLLYSLMRRYSCGSVSELVALRDSLSSTLCGSGELGLRIAELERDILARQAGYDALCDKLHFSRVSAAPAFSAEICKSLKFLELERATFSIAVSDSAPGASGRDAVSYMFDANGSAAAPLQKCASGGELSRIMLCLKEMMSRFSGMPTMIFDEIDTGVSGSVADRTGSMICRMAASGQVMAITHLPQVAAKGSAHFLVRKTESPDGKMRSHMERLDDKGRLLEIARLLSGSTITPEAMANAASLLNFD